MSRNLLNILAVDFSSSHLLFLEHRVLKETAEYRVAKERGVAQVTLVLRVLLVSLVSK